MVGGSGWGGAVGRPRIVCYSQGGWCYSQGTARVGSATARVGSGIGWVMGFSCQGQGFVCYRSEGQAPRPLPLPPPPASCPLQKDSAQALYEEARRRWVEDYEERLAEWEGMHTQLESQRDEAQAALEDLQRMQLQRAAGGGSRPTSAARRALSRPTSARVGGAPAPRPPSAKSAGAGPGGPLLSSSSRPPSASGGAGMSPLPPSSRPQSASLAHPGSARAEGSYARLATAHEDVELLAWAGLEPGGEGASRASEGGGARRASGGGAGVVDWSPPVSRPTSARHRYSSPGRGGGSETGGSPLLLSRPGSAKGVAAVSRGGADSPALSMSGMDMGEVEAGTLAGIAEEVRGWGGALLRR